MSEFLAVYGSSAKDGKAFKPELVAKAQALGRVIAEHPNVNVLFGAGSGLPLEVVSTAKLSGASVYGFSPSENFDQADELGKQSSGFVRQADLREASSAVVFLVETQDMNEDERREWQNRLGIGSTNQDDASQKARFVYRSELINDLLADAGGVVLIVGGGPDSGTEREMIGALSKGIPVGILGGTGKLSDLAGSLNFGFFEKLSAQSSKSIAEIDKLVFVEDDPHQLVAEAVKMMRAYQSRGGL